MRIHRITALALYTLGLGGLLVATLRADDLKKEDPLNLSGTYTVVSGEKDGKPVPEAELKGSVVHFTKDKITGTDKDKKEFFACTYTVEIGKEKNVIRMKETAPKDGEATGLIKREGDAVTLIYALPGGKDPTEFKTGENQHMFVMKRLDRISK